MLSRHFYEINEVCYALIQSLRKGLIEESVFWARELVLSEEYELLQKTIIQAWILWLGARNIHWLDAWSKCSDVDYNQKYSLIGEFCSLRNKMDKITKKTCLYPFIICSRDTAGEYNEERILEALESSNPFHLYYYLGNEYVSSPTAATEYISTLVESVNDPIVEVMKTVKSVKLKMLLTACAAQVACLKIYPCDLTVQKEGFVSELLIKWEPLLNKRKGRLFRITEAHVLQGKKRLTQEQALFIGHKEIFANGCAYWKKYADSDLDESIDALFPDDIPDEWSYKDRAFSHPVKWQKYTVYYRPEYKFKQIWGFSPFLKRSWISNLDAFWNACACPSI